MTASEREDKLANAKAQGQAQFDSIREMVEQLQEAQKGLDQDECDDNVVLFENAEQAIMEDALTVEVRSDWYAPGQYGTGNDRTAEYRILLCTGGPAVQIVGKLSEHGEPETAVMQVQDWFMPWTDFMPVYDAMAHSGDGESSEEIMLAYARCFYFGE